MKHRKVLIIALMMALLMMTIPVAAQDGGEQADPIDLIFAANDNLLAAEYFGFTASQTQRQNIISGIGRRQSDLQRTTELDITNGQIQIDAAGVPQQVAITVDQSDTQLVNTVSRSAATLTMNSEFRYVGGDLYVRVSRISGILNDRAIEAAPSNLRSRLGNSFLTGWVNISANPEQLADDFEYLTINETQANLLDFLNIDALAGLGGGLSFTREAVVFANPVPGNDPEVLTFSVELNPQEMLAHLDIASLVNVDGMTGDVNLMLQELFAAMTITQQITVTLDQDGNPTLTGVTTRLVADVTFSDGSQPIDNPPNATGGVALRLVLDTTTTVTYSNVGRAFELSVPTPEVQLATTCDSETLEGRFTITNRGANMEASVPYSISREGAIPTEKQLQLEAGTRLVETVRDGEFTLTIPEFNIDQTLNCVRAEAPPAETEADAD